MTEATPLRQTGSEVTAVRPESPEFRLLFQREVSYVVHTLRRLGVREGDLPDQAQEVFLTVHALMDDYDPARPPRPWLFGIAYRAASRYRRLARNARELPTEFQDDLLGDGTPLADDRMVQREALDVAVQALNTIELSRRSVFILSEIDGLTIPEVATTLEIPLNTAYSRLRLAREDFGAAIKRLNARARA